MKERDDDSRSSLLEVDISSPVHDHKIFNSNINIGATDTGEMNIGAKNIGAKNSLMIGEKDLRIEAEQNDHKLSEEYVKNNDGYLKQQKRIADLEAARRNVMLNMPEQYDSERLVMLQSGQDRMVSDLAGMKKRDRRYDGMRRHGNLQAVQAEVNEINEVLYWYNNQELEAHHLEEDGVDTQKLKLKLSFDLMHLLINEHSKGDSKEMRSVKTDIMKLATSLEASKTLPCSAANLYEIIAMYTIALKSCEDYLETKNPKTTKGKNRYEAVRKVWLSLMEQSMFIRNYTERLPRNSEQTSIGQLLHMSEDKPENVQRVDINRPVAEQAPSSDALFVQNIFRTNYNFSASFSAMGTRRSKRERESAKVVALRDELTQFTPGQTEVRDITVMGKKVRILQKADNTLFILDDHRQLPLGMSAGLCVNKIEKDMLTYASAYGSGNINHLMDDYSDEEKITTGEHLRMRTNLIEFLMQDLDLPQEEFTNIRKRSMVDYTRRLTSAGPNQLALVKEEIRHEITHSVKSAEMINGVELTEIMERDIRRREEILDHVSIYEMQNAADQDDWSEEEKKVRNLLADFVYPEDTMIMDNNVEHPEEFIRTVLLTNSKALAILIKENKENENDLITSIFKKMSLDQVIGDNQNNFADTIAKNVRDFCARFRQNNQGLNTVEEIEARLKVVLEDTENENMKNYLVQMHKDSEDSVKESCELLQNDVSKIANNIFAKPKVEKNQTLESIMENSSRSEKGQGKFTRNVFDNYFKMMKPIDQRAMLASVLRSSGMVQKVEYEDEELVKEIIERKLSGYETLTDNRNYKRDPLTAEEKAKVDAYRKEKERTRFGANYLGGLIRGAGPLFQKMMQGLPEESLPVEIRIAIRDVKSKLPPMPERVIISQINAMIERSGRSINRINVEKNLGAATVGQTFLCRMFGPKLPKEGKQVVIKLLRPDVQNRMTREEEVMLECARNTDESMEATYKGQLENYRKELDLSNEAKNIREGEVYNGKYGDVEVVKINDVIDSTVNSLVLELADGKTLDDILLDAQKLQDDIRKELCFKDTDENGNVKEFDFIEFNHEKFPKMKEARIRLVKEANDLIKKRDIMANVAKNWVEEALVRSGYFHADLHAGNVMISEEKGTMIDFGNISKFNEDQKKAIARMIAASVEDEPNVDMFFEAFDSVMDQNDPNYTEEKKAEVKNAFREVLSLGDEFEVGELTGERIACALIKAQELGVKLPPELYNFSQGQLRLQKSINDINKSVRKIKGTIDWIDRTRDGTFSADLINFVNDELYTTHAKDAGAVVKNYVDMFEPVDKEEFVRDLLDNTYKKAEPHKGIEGVNKRKDFDKKYLGSLSHFERDVTSRGSKCMIDRDGNIAFIAERDKNTKKIKKTVPLYQYFKKNYEDYKEKYASQKGTKEQKRAGRELIDIMCPGNILDPVYTSFGGYNYLSQAMSFAVEDMDDDTVYEILEVYEKYFPLAQRMEKLISELREGQDNKDLSKAQTKGLTDEIYRCYNEIHEFKARRNPAMISMRTDLQNLNNFRNIKRRMKGVASEKTKKKVMENGVEKERELGELFMEKMEAYEAFAKPYADENKIAPGFREGVPDDVKEEIRKRQKEILDLHFEISRIQIRRYYDGRFDQKISIKYYEFGEIMGDVIKGNLKKFVEYLGFFYSAKQFGAALLNSIK